MVMIKIKNIYIYVFNDSCSLVSIVLSLLLKCYSNWKAFNHYLGIKRRTFSLSPLQELEVVEGTEHMLTGEKFLLQPAIK